MDPIAHTFAGAALAKTRLGRVTPLATTTLILAANAPDIDGVVGFFGSEVALAHRRGLTHGLFAVPFLAAGVTGIVAGFDRWVRRSRDPGAVPIRAGPVFLLALLGVLTHPFLDWLNTYGMRWLLPFDGRWSYGDALFILDPWLWLGLGGVVFLSHSKRWWSLGGWIVLWLLMSALMLLSERPPLVARIVWLAGSLAFAAARWRQGATAGPAGERVAAYAVVLAGVYVFAMVSASAAASRVAGVEIARGDAGMQLPVQGDGSPGAGGAASQSPAVHEVTFNPEPADPFRGYLVVVSDEAYHQGTFDWLRRPRTHLDGPVIPKLRWVDAGDAEADGTRIDAPGPDRRAVIEAARRAETGRLYLHWSRHPFFEVTHQDGGYRVRIGDARFSGLRPARGLGQAVLHLGPDLEERRAGADAP